MRVISLCVDGIEQAARRGLYQWLADQDADIVCLQDLRAWEGKLQDDIYYPKEYQAYFFDAVEDKCNGVAIYCKKPPKAIMTGLGFLTADQEGRYIQADYEELSIGCLLAPMATNEVASLESKMQFFDDFQAHLDKITGKRRQYIICGNWNIAHKHKDVEHAEKYEDASGFMPYERQWMDIVYSELGYVDAFRAAISDEDAFTWWPSGQQSEGDGWRVDTQIISSTFKQYVEYAGIYRSQAFSSHAPVIVDYDYEL